MRLDEKDSVPVSLRVTLTRRGAMQFMASAATTSLLGCGGGGEPVGSGAISASASSSTSSSSSSVSSTTSASVFWGNTGWDATPVYTSTAIYPALNDFVAVNPPAIGTYAFRLPQGCNNTSNKTYTDSSGNSVTIVCSAGGDTVALNTVYYMGKFLVTNANWKGYCEATGALVFPSYWVSGQYPAGRENYPVMGLSYNQILPYTAWLSGYLGKTVSVPSEEQWEWAALGTNSTWIYPWGTSAGFGSTNAVTFGAGTIRSLFNSNAVCADRALTSGMTTLTYYADTDVYQGAGYDVATDTAVLTAVTQLTYSSGSVAGWQYDSDTNKMNADFANSDQFKRIKDVWGGYTTPVGYYEGGKSWCGCYDMSGNAFEWTSSQGLATNGVEAGSTEVKVVRGGSWYSTGASGSCVMRGEGRLPGSGTFSIGFRVCYV